jgi:Leucine-rich repeat (LRR) protein
LYLNSTKLGDLSPLAGMPLTSLDLSENRVVTDLSPLRGAPLVDLSLGFTPVTSLAPLAGAPLKRLRLYETRVADLTPLAECVQLEELTLRFSPVADLTPLARLHLSRLDCSGGLAGFTKGTKFTSIAALRGQPLRSLLLTNANVTDLTPLSECTTLEEILLPEKATDVSVLRKLPRLRAISYRIEDDHPAQTAEEFWKEYDAKRGPAAK